MTLKKQTLTFPFAKGLNEKASDKVTPVGELTEAKNVVFDKAGQLVKRGSYIKQTTTGIAFSDAALGDDMDAADYATSYGDEILVAGQQRLFARAGGGLSYAFSDKGSLISCEMTNPFLLRNENYKHGPAHVAYGYNGSVPAFMLVTYARINLFGSDSTSTTTYQIIGEVRDAETSNLIHEELIDTVHIDKVGDDRLYRIPNPRAVVLGDYGYILYMEPQMSAATKVRYVGIDLTAPIDAGSRNLDGSGFVGPADLPSFTVSYHRPMFDVDVATAAGNTTVAGESCHGSAAVIVGGLTGSNLNPSFTLSGSETRSSDATVTVSSTSTLRVGDFVSGTNIQAGSKVLSITDGTDFELNQVASGAGTGITLTFTRGPDESSSDGTLKFEYFKSSGTSLAQFGTPKVTTALTVSNDGAGSASAAESMPAPDTNNATTSGFAIKAINDSTASNGQIFYAVSSYKGSGVNIRQKYALIAHGLGSEVTLLNASSSGYLIRATAYSESSTVLRVVAEISDRANGSKASLRPGDHRVISFEMNREGSTTSFSTEKVVGYNSSIASDLFNNGTNTYFVLSFTNGTRNSLSGNNLLMLAPPVANANLPWEIVGAVGMGDHSVNFSSDHQSALESNFKLFGHPSRVIGYSNKYYFGTNRFSNIIEYVQSDDASKANTFEDESHSPALMTIDFAPARKHKSLTTPNGMLLTGGLLYHYDGFRLHENNFFGFPVFSASGANVGAHLADGTYLYRVVYEWYDDMGNVHRSAASESEGVTISGGGDTGLVTLTIYVLQHTRKREGTFVGVNSGLRACVYRTTAAGSVYHKVGSANLSGEESNRVVTFKDYGGVTDALLVNNELLYTQAGLTANAFIGSCKDLCMHKERAFVTTSTNSVKYSKYMVGRDGVNFTDDGTIRVGSEKTDVTAIESSREALLLLTETDGYYIAGDGPDNAGVGSFTQPRMFAPGIGAVAGADHGHFSGGTLFQTNLGIMNILPNLQPDYIGANIEDSLLNVSGSANSTVLSFLVTEDSNEVRLLLQNTQSASYSRSLVYNTLFKQWTTHDVAYSSSNYGVSSFVHGSDNGIYLATADGNLHKYSFSKYTDDNTGADVNYDMVVQTGYLNVSGLQSLQRVYRVMLLGTHAGNHTLTFDVYTDYDDSTSSTFSKVLSSDANPYNYRVHLSNQKCRAVKVKVTISASSTPAVKLDGIALEVGARPGTFKLPAAQTIGA